MLQTVNAAQASKLIEGGAILVDIREADEHARERIPGARHAALSRLERDAPQAGSAGTVIFHCRSGGRTSANAARLKAATPCEAYVLDGGLESWKAAGLPVEKDARQPIEIMRQVQIGAGGLVLAGVILSQLVNPAWIGLSAFVGAGLVFAGVSGWCGMAKALAYMPWNKRSA
jgi:rhodanese-related sulfurtransferase